MIAIMPNLKSIQITHTNHFISREVLDFPISIKSANSHCRHEFWGQPRRSWYLTPQTSPYHPTGPSAQPHRPMGTANASYKTELAKLDIEPRRVCTVTNVSETRLQYIAGGGRGNV